MTRVVVVGAAGLLGRELVSAFRAAGDEVISLTRAEVELDDPSTMSAIRDARPEVVVNSAAWTDVDGCARDPDRAMRINGTGAGLVADAAADAGALTVQMSTNEVFDGSEARAYTEGDTPNPINPYGASKLAGELAVAAAGRHLIVRTAWLFSSSAGFPTRIAAAARRAAERGTSLRVVDDEWGNPTWVPELARTVVRLVGMRLAGTAPSIVHLAGEPPVTRFDWARGILADGPVRLERISSAQYERPSNVPFHAVLSMALAASLGLPSLDWRGASQRVPQ